MCSDYAGFLLAKVADKGVFEFGPDAVHVETARDSELQPDPSFDGVEETGRDPVSTGRCGAIVAARVGNVSARV